MKAMVAAGCLAAAVLLLLPGPPRRRWRAVGVRAAAWDPQAGAAWRDARLLALRRRLTARRSALRRRERALEVCDAFAAELRAGRAVRAALVRAATGVGDCCSAALSACRLGGDVVVALREDAARSGVGLWGSLAACWVVGEGSGAGLAAAVDRLVAAARSDEEVRREVVAALAAPRATAQVLAVLPVFGMVLGTALGAQPVAWLTGSVLGLAVLAAGVAAAVAGVLWTGRIARAVERRL